MSATHQRLPYFLAMPRSVLIYELLDKAYGGQLAWDMECKWSSAKSVVAGEIIPTINRFSLNFHQLWFQQGEVKATLLK